MNGELEVGDWERDKGWHMTSVAGRKTSVLWLFEPITANSSRLTFITKYEVPGSSLGAVLDKLSMARTKPGPRNRCKT
jgi:hypothetical protein